MSSIERSNGQPTLGEIVDRKLQRRVNGVEQNGLVRRCEPNLTTPGDVAVQGEYGDQSSTDLDAEFASLLFGKPDVRLIPKLEDRSNPNFDSKQKIVGTKQNFLTLNKQEDCKSQSESECKPVEFQLVNVLEHPIQVSVQKRRGMVKMILSLPVSSPLDAPRIRALEKCLQNHFTQTLGVDFLVEVKSDC